MRETLKKLKLKLSVARVAIGVLVLGLVVGGVSLVLAWSGSDAPANLIEGGNVTINQNFEAQDVVQPEQSFGSVVSADSLPPMVCSADSCEYTFTGNWKDATTTLFYIVDPFKKATSTASDVVIETIRTGYGLTGASSTVDLVALYSDGTATTTYHIGCSSAPTQYATSTAGNTILLTGTIATSSAEYLLENNYGATAVSGAFVATDSVAKIQIGPSNPYLVCQAFQTYGETNSAFTGADNTVSGHYVVRVRKPRF